MPSDPPPTEQTRSFNESLIERCRAFDGGRNAIAREAGFGSVDVIPTSRNEPLPTWEVVQWILYVSREDSPYEPADWKRRWDEARRSQHDAQAAQQSSTPPGGCLRRFVRPIALVAIAVVLLACGVVAGVWFGPVLWDDMQPPVPVSHSDECVPDVVRRGHECVGITDGGFAFDSPLGLEPILGEIKKENDRVYASAKPSVSVAYVVALPLDTSDRTAAETVRSELRGAAVAQQRMNLQLPSSAVPQIRLLVANVGDHGGLWNVVAPMLDAQTRLPNRLVAVAGLGDDGSSTRQLIASLSGAGIPLYPSRLSSEPMPVAGAGRIYHSSPALEAQARAAVSSLDAGAVLEVRDVSRPDTYGQEFASAVDAQLPTRPDVVLTETKSFIGGPEAATAFRQMQDRICQVRPRTVLFSGRGRDLLAFLPELRSTAGRCWNGDPITVVTGDDGAAAVTALRIGAAGGDRGAAAALGGGTVTLRFTPSTESDDWAGRPFPEIAPFVGPSCPFCLTTLFPQAPVDDVTFRAYDSVLLPVTTLRRAVAVRPELAKPYELTAKVMNEIALGVDEAAPVEGVGGPIAFDPGGRLVGRTPPVVEVDARGDTRTVRTGTA